jgi:hypothetical protein
MTEHQSSRTKSLPEIIGGLMLIDDWGDIHEELNNLCDIAGIPRPEGNYYDGWTDQDLANVGVEVEVGDENGEEGGVEDVEEIGEEAEDTGEDEAEEEDDQEDEEDAEEDELREELEGEKVQALRMRLHDDHDWKTADYRGMKKAELIDAIVNAELNKAEDESEDEEENGGG